MDAYQDLDGCPDLTTPVRIILLDKATNAPIPGASAVVSGPNGERLTGDDDFVVDAGPGTHAITAEAARYLPLKGQLEVVNGPPQEFKFWVEKDLVPGVAKVKVTDGKGALLDATLAFDDAVAQPVPQGLAERSLPPGEHVMLVRVDGYVPASMPITVKEGGTASYNVVMQPSRVKVTREKLEIQDKIYFETGKAVIKPESFGLLDEVAGILLAVRKYLVDRGVEDARLTSLGFGESKPIDPTNNAVAWRRTAAWSSSSKDGLTSD